MYIGEKLKKLRGEKTQDTVIREMEKMGIYMKKTQLSRLENYTNEVPDTKTIKDLKKYYNVSYDYLLDDECENKTNETMNIGKILKLSDSAIQKIIDLQSSTARFIGDLEKTPIFITDKIAPKYFNFFLENLNLETLSYELKELCDMHKIYIDLNFFTSYSFFLDYFKQCIENNITNDLNDFIKFSDFKLNELQSLIFDTDLGSDNCIELIINDYNEIKSHIENKQPEDLEITIMDFNDTCIELLSKSFRQIKYFRYSLTETFQDCLNIINNNIDFKEYKCLKFKQIKKYYQHADIQDYFGQEIE